ncbi:BglG family transcription antiterminator [Alteribacter salitolerans]|uniref:BglG family transcription antiterminator n=1 Tax=Alteribacter salitolerans TaxID=2912333 RepID=UPI0023502A11|nr:BglG family transcription antiterminator [Alteribacter salitolerans]
MVPFNQRRLLIMKELLTATAPITAKKLASLISCSERTVREDIQFLNMWLKELQYPELLRKPNLGYLLQVNDVKRACLREDLESIDLTHYEFSRDERINFMTLELLTVSKPTTISKFEQLFQASRGTIMRDLTLCETNLSSFDIKMVKKPKRGIWIEGEELLIRSALSHTCKTMDPLLIQVVARNHERYESSSEQQVSVSKSMAHIVDELQVEEIKEIVEPILSWKEITLSDDSRLALYMHIGMVLKRIRSSNSFTLPEEDLSAILKQREFHIGQLLAFQLEKYFHIHIPEQEVAYITLHLMGGQNAPSNKIAGLSRDEDEGLLQLIMEMTKAIEKRLGLSFEKKENLYHGLLLHMRPAIFRAKYGLTENNTLLEDIRQEFYNLFEAIKSEISMIEEEYQVQFPQEEVAYIAMHYGSAVGIVGEEKEDKLLRIMIVCNSGVGTANLLKNRITSLFEGIHIIETLSYQRFQKEDKWEEVDLIVSTIDIESPLLPVLKVNPLLPPEDYERLSRYAEVKGKAQSTSQEIYETVWPLIEKHCDIKDSKALTREMIEQVDLLLKKNRTGIPMSLGSLEGILTADMIQLNEKASSWQEAIAISTAPLERSGLVHGKYKERIIEALNERGPYMAVVPEIVLAHAAPDAHFPRVGLSMTRFDEGVTFGHAGNDPIYYVFVFSSPDQTSQVPALQQLFQELIKNDKKDQLRKAKHSWDILKVFSQ